MKLVVVSGRSGSGKTSALHVLEDMGYYCVDNLPVTLLPALTQSLNQVDHTHPQDLAVGIDARNRAEDLERVEAILKEVRQQGVRVEVFYLDASDDVLIQRFHSTRRKHPLSNASQSLKESMQSERRLLDHMSSQATMRIDTSAYNIHKLREEFRRRVEAGRDTSVVLLIESFAYKNGVPADADFVFDVRCLPNPHWQQDLREQTGLDAGVAAFLQSQEVVGRFLDDTCDYLQRWLPRFNEGDRSYLTIAMGCTGGQHRSVYIAERLAERLHHLGHTQVQIRHRELSLPPGTPP